MWVFLQEAALQPADGGLNLVQQNYLMSLLQISNMSVLKNFAWDSKYQNTTLALPINFFLKTDKWNKRFKKWELNWAALCSFWFDHKTIQEPGRETSLEKAIKRK